MLTTALCSLTICSPTPKIFDESQVDYCVDPSAPLAITQLPSWALPTHPVVLLQPVVLSH